MGVSYIRSLNFNRNLSTYSNEGVGMSFSIGENKLIYSTGINYIIHQSVFVGKVSTDFPNTLAPIDFRPLTHTDTLVIHAYPYSIRKQSKNIELNQLCSYNLLISQNLMVNVKGGLNIGFELYYKELREEYYLTLIEDDTSGQVTFDPGPHSYSKFYSDKGKLPIFIQPVLAVSFQNKLFNHFYLNGESMYLLNSVGGKHFAFRSPYLRVSVGCAYFFD